MRHEKAARLLDLARMLASSAEGMTLDEMAQALDVGRRTAERMRDAVWAAFPQMEVVEDPPTRRFRIPAGLDGLFQTPTAEELAALRTAADSYKSSGADGRAASLYGLERKLLSALRGAARRKVAPDVEALVQAETIGVHAGPRPYEDDAVLGAIRMAIKGLSALAFRYDGGSTPGRTREVTPLGILFARSNYLVALEGDDPRPRSWVDLQLPLYAWLARRIWPEQADKGVEVGYFLLPPDGDLGDKALEIFSLTAEMQSSAEKCAERIAQLVKGGHFWPPSPSSEVEFDDFKDWFMEEDPRKLIDEESARQLNGNP